jgi:hypothetical protein
MLTGRTRLFPKDPVFASHRSREMANQIIAYVKDVSADTSYTVTVYDLFGGGNREVDGSPFALNPNETSSGFSVYVDNAGVGVIRCVDPAGNPLCPDTQVTASNPTVTFPP